MPNTSNLHQQIPKHIIVISHSREVSWYSSRVCSVLLLSQYISRKTEQHRTSFFDIQTLYNIPFPQLRHVCICILLHYVYLGLCASPPLGMIAQVPLPSKLKTSSGDNSGSCHNASYVRLSPYLPGLCELLPLSVPWGRQLSTRSGCSREEQGSGDHSF